MYIFCLVLKDHQRNRSKAAPSSQKQQLNILLISVSTVFIEFESQLRVRRNLAWDWKREFVGQLFEGTAVACVQYATISGPGEGMGKKGEMWNISLREASLGKWISAVLLACSEVLHAGENKAIRIQQCDVESENDSDLWINSPAPSESNTPNLRDDEELKEK